MAEHVTKNGIVLENTVKTEDAHNPQLQLLLCDDGGECYQALLQASKPTNPPSPVNEKAPDLSELMRRWPTPASLPIPDG
jgi:hypothetical protein